MIKIQELEMKEQVEVSRIESEEVVRRLLRDKGEREVFCYMHTANEKSITSKHNQFFMSFLHPYNQHGDVLLVPDDVWIAISLFLAQYIDSNAEKLRHKFVKHEGKKDLVVYEHASSVEQSLLM